MTTYANIKLSEIFALYGNPFSRGSCKKNFNQKIMKKHIKKINFEEIIKNEINQKNELGNSNLNVLDKNEYENGRLMLLKNIFNENNNKSKSITRIENLNQKNISYKNSSKIHLNTDSFSICSFKKRTQQEFIRKTRANFTSEENIDNTKMSSILIKKFKDNTSQFNSLFFIFPIC